MMTAPTETSPAPEQLAVPLNLEGTPDSRAIAQDFLEHYESFVDGAHDHWLSWQTPPFYVEDTPVTESRVWAKAGVAGMVGLAAMTAASVLLPQDTVSAIAQVPQKLPSPAVAPNSATSSPQVALPALPSITAIAPAEVLPQVSSFTATAADPAPTLTIPAVSSPAIRSPWPAGQVIGQQPSGVAQAGLPQAQFALTKLPQLALPKINLPQIQSSQIQSSQIESTKIESTKIESTKIKSTKIESSQANLSSVQLPQPESFQRKSSLGESSTTASPQPALLREIGAPLTIGTPQAMPSTEWSPGSGLNAIQSPSSAEPEPTTTFHPPAEPSTEKQPTLAAPGASGVLPQPSTPVVPEFTETHLNQTGNPSLAAIKLPGVFSINPSPQVHQAIATAQTLQDFLKLSQKIPENAQAVLSLTPQAALAVPNAPMVANLPATGEQSGPQDQTGSQNQTPATEHSLPSFQVFRLPATLYQKAWIALTQTNGQAAVPTHGFIDYQERAIVLPSL